MIKATYKKFQYKAFAPEWAGRPFNVAIVADARLEDNSYKGRRYMVVLEEVDTEDLNARELLSRKAPASRWIPAALDLGIKYAMNAGHNVKDDPAIAYVNFNYTKTYDLGTEQRNGANRLASKRVMTLIEKLGITDVLILGDEAAISIYQDAMPDLYLLNALKTRGRPRKDSKGVWWTNTISLSRAYGGNASVSSTKDAYDDAYDDEGKVAVANLLGYVSRCAGNFFLRDLVYKAPSIKPKPILIDTTAKFDRMFDIIWQAPTLAIDTETRGLGRVVNNVFTIQFATDHERGFVLPIRHPESPWKPDQLELIEKRMRQLFSRKTPPLSSDLSRYTIWQNAKFDVTIIRQWLQMHHLSPRLWDVMAGQYLHDENYKALSDFRLAGFPRISPYTLDFICAWYGIDFYMNAEFSKHNRHDMINRSLRDRAVLEYSSMDVQVLHPIMQLQRQQAQNFLLEGEPWGEGFDKMMLLQMSPIIYVESVMEHRGDHLDIPYMMELLDNGSEFQQAKRKLLAEFAEYPSVRNVNSRLLKEGQNAQKDLFGEQQWLFSVTKPDHKHKLFIEELGLEPVEYGKSGAPSFDKKFQAKYAKEVPEVALFHKVASVATVENTYIKAFYKRVAADPDMSYDHRLRASYGFTGTVTGRSNSYEPNLQNIPQRGDFAKFIKRAFTAPPGFLILKLDYKAHEVRMLGLVAEDSLLCSLFVLGRWFTQMYRKTGNKAYKVWMKTIGDIHRLNVAFFFNTTPEAATEEQRDSVKSIVFGTIYGRGARAIAEQAKAKVQDIKQLLVRFFERFFKSAKWLDSVKKMSITKGYSFSPIKRVRHMFAHLFGLDSLVAATERRGPNAAVQSIAADIGHVAAYLYHIHMLRVCRQWKLDEGKILKAGISAFVHDAIKGDAPYEYLLACVQVFQWCATTGVMQYYKKHWGMDFSVEIEVEIELAAHDEKHWKWDWFDGNVGDDKSGGLDYIIRKALLDQKKVYPAMDVKAAYRQIVALKQNTELMQWLDAEYPVLQNWPDATRVSKKEAQSYIDKAKDFK